MVTRLDVARRAGTSPALVSYVINGGPRQVAPATESRIRRAIEELGYRPNRLARSLRMNETLTLGLVIPDSANPYFAELANAIEHAAFDAGYTLLIGNSAERPDREQRYLDTFVDHQVDGIILVPAAAAGGGPRLPQLPLVLVDRSLPSLGAPIVTVDNHAAAAQATTHLIAHGRQRIACVAGPEGVSPAEGRVGGYRTALADAGLEVDPGLISRAGFGPRAGYEATLQLFTHAAVQPDAVFFASDEQAIGALKALDELQLHCPADVAVAAFDGISTGAFARPGITTMAQPFESMGAASVDRVLSQLQGEKAGPADVLVSTLIVRESCGCTVKEKR